MRKTISTLYIVCLTVLSAAAQPRFTSNAEVVHLGQIEWKHPVTVKYDITNTGNEPLVLSEVEPDCACAVPQWTQTPIAPGEKGQLSVVFDAAMLGHFHKSVAIVTNAEPHLILLKFTGEVVREITDYSRTHPFLIGDIRIDRTALNFPDVSMGSQTSICLSVVNQSGQPYKPVLMHLPTFLEAKAEPEVLQDGEKGLITLTVHSDKLTDYGLTESVVYLSRFEGDKVDEENVLPVSVVLLPDLSGQSEAEAPSLSLSAHDIDLSAILSHKSRASQDITIVNEGHSLLVISKIQVLHPAVGVRLKKNVLQAGESVRMHVTVTKRHLRKSSKPLRVLMITNDRAQPKVEISIKH